jgi:hypothetical protein
VKTSFARPADAEEICKLLEQAVLKYFPRPIETVDTFICADDGTVGDIQSARPAPATTALDRVKRGLSLIRFTHPF